MNFHEDKKEIQRLHDMTHHRKNVVVSTCCMLLFPAKEEECRAVPCDQSPYFTSKKLGLPADFCYISNTNKKNGKRELSSLVHFVLPINFSFSDVLKAHVFQQCTKYIPGSRIYYCAYFRYLHDLGG